MSGGGVLSKKDFEEVAWFFALAAGGFDEAAKDAVVLESLLAASALNDAAHDDHRAQALLGVVGQVSPLHY